MNGNENGIENGSEHAATAQPASHPGPAPAAPPATSAPEPPHAGEHDGQPDRDQSGEPHGDLVLTGIGELLTAVPYLLGFTPQQALIALALTGGAVEATTHADLPVWDTPAAIASLAEAFTPVRPEAVTLIGYGDAGSVEPRLQAVASRLPWRVRDLIRVHRGHWWSLNGPAHTGGPVRRRPLPRRPDLAAGLLAAYGPPAAAPPTMADLLGLTSGNGDSGHLQAQTRERLQDLPPHSDADLYRAILAARLARRHTRIPLEPAQAAVLLHAVSHTSVHDTCAAWNPAPAALNLWMDLLPAAPPGWAAPVARLLALTAYQRDQSALAHHVLALALRDDPQDTCTLVIARWFLLGIPAAQLTALLTGRRPDHPDRGPDRGRYQS